MDSMYMRVAAGLMLDWPSEYDVWLEKHRDCLEKSYHRSLGENKHIVPHMNTKKMLDGFLVFEDGKLAEMHALTRTSKRGIIDMLEKGREAA